MPDRPDPPLLEVGRIVRPHGLKGGVVVELWTNRAERVEAGSVLESDRGALTVSSARPLTGSGAHDRWLVDFAGVASREAAEALRDVVLRAEPIEVEGALWVHELVGARVLDPAGQVLGTVAAVESNPASDLLVLEDGKLIPLTFVTDQGEGELTVDLPPGLFDL